MSANGGQVVILNGTSSSGKTTLARALQVAMDEPYLEAGLDRFLWALPARYLNTGLWHEVFRYDWPPDGDPAGLVIRPGPVGDKLVAGMHQAVAALARAGNNVVADHVLLDPSWLTDCARALDGCRVLFVGVVCRPEVLEARERARGDRTLGQAGAQVGPVHAHGAYDLEVDTAELDPVAAADVIRRTLAEQPRDQESVLARFR
jgi:chloramphenicol 3-O phosphotransferase